MPLPPQTLTDIPEVRVAEIVESFRREGATKITQEKAHSGAWVVTAEFALTAPPEGMLDYMRNPLRQKKTILTEAS